MTHDEGRPFQPVPRRLTEAERNQRLDLALASRFPAFVVVGSQGYSGPIIKRLSPVAAEITYVTPPTQWAVVLFGLLWTTLTCGIYLPFWFVQTLRKPQVDRLFVDEWGNAISTRNPVSPAQRVLSVVVGLLLLWWLFFFLPSAVHAFNEVTHTTKTH